MAALQDFAGKAMSWGELHRRVRAWYAQRCIEPECEGFAHDFGRCRDHLMSDIETPWHGTFSTYRNHDCRCDPCVDAARSYWRESGARRRARQIEANQAHRRVVPGR
jgi:hypothetical protein